MDNSIEVVWSKFNIGSESFLLGVMYKPPSSNEENMYLISYELYTTCDKYKNYNICMSGDFNLPNINRLIPYPINNDVITTQFVLLVIDNGFS